MPTRRAAQRLHPALAISMALGLHAAVFVAVRLDAVRFDAVRFDAVRFEAVRFEAAAPAPGRSLEPIEFSMLSEPAEPAGPDAHQDVPPARDTDAQRVLPRSVRATARRAIAALAPETADETGSPPPEATDGADGTAPSKPINLGLNGGVRRAALSEGWLEPVERAKPPSDGGLSAGLAALDAERGQSRSNPANHAAYQAARRFAPPQGMGIFDILTDDHGVVLSVHLASAPADEARWQRVAEELRTLLKDRRLRVPPGAKGLAARLRIETGDLAKDIADRFRTPRGAALGQGDGHPREQRPESTRASLEPGQLSPTLGITLAGGGGNDPNIRIVLVSERAL
jgi:hypothetical protein